MKLLFVDACPRKLSRTEALCRAFLDEWRAQCPSAEIERLFLPEEGLTPLLEADIARRDELIASAAWDDPSLRWAVQLMHADVLLIGTPCWDMSFPALLKCWVEHVCVRNLTFAYREGGRLEGLCHARAAYLTTIGGYFGPADHGAGYLRDVLGMLGIASLSSVRAEGLDIEGADVNALLQAASDEARCLARALSAKNV